MASEPVNPLANGLTAELYKAAIGPEGQDYYLRRFLQFDANGKTGPSWHWPACGATLSWLVFRKMWRWALAYGAALLGLALLMFGVGKLAFHYSDATGLLLLLLFVTAAVVLPGLYANAWYYTDCSKKISTALRDAATVKEACDALAGQASTRRRWFGLAAVNGVALALVAGGATLVLHPGQQGVHLAAQSGLVRAAASDLAVAAQPAAVAAADTDPQTGTVKSEQPVAAAADSDSQAKVVRTNSDATSKAVHARRQWFVQIGAFARETNAQNVRAKVDATGLPSAAEASATPAGRLIRVRAGPFDSKGDAEKAALQIKALELPAVLVRQ